MKKMFPFRFGAAGVVSSAKSSGLNIFAKLLLRLRAIALALRLGLALRATPAAPNRKGNIFFMARPPLLCEEGNLLSDAGFVRFQISSCLNFGFVKYVDALKRRGMRPTKQFGNSFTRSPPWVNV